MTSAELLKRTGAAMLAGAICAFAAAHMAGAGGDNYAHEPEVEQDRSSMIVAQLTS